MACMNSLSGKQRCDMAFALPRYYEFNILLEKEKRNEKNRKPNDEKLCRRAAKKKPYERNYHHEQKKRELSPKRKVSGLEASNAEAVDVNAAYAEAVDGNDAYAEAVDANASYADDGYAGKELVLYGEKDISDAERSGNEEVFSDHEKMEFLPVNIPKKKRSVTPPVEKDDDHLHEPMNDDDASEITDSEYEEDYEEEEEEKPRKKKPQGNRNMRNKSKSTEPAPPQDLSEVMQPTAIEIGGAAPVNWIDEKSLTKSDVTRQQGRLFIPQHVKKFLTPAELKKYWVLQGNNDRGANKNNEQKKEYSITLVEPDGKASEIDFKIWASLGKGDKPGEGQPVLTGSNWNALVRKYNLVEGSKLQFWCFRKADTNEFCFAINNKV